MQTVRQTRVAELADISETRLSRMHVPQGKDERSDIEMLCAIAAACGLALVPCTHRNVDPDRLRALAILARDSIEADFDHGGEAQDSGMGQL